MSTSLVFDVPVINSPSVKVPTTSWILNSSTDSSIFPPEVVVASLTKAVAPEVCPVITLPTNSVPPAPLAVVALIIWFTLQLPSEGLIIYSFG